MPFLNNFSTENNYVKIKSCISINHCILTNKFAKRVNVNPNIHLGMN